MEEEESNETLRSVYRLRKKFNDTVTWLLWIGQLAKEETAQENWWWYGLENDDLNVATASVVTGDASACMTTSMANTIAIKHFHLMMCVLAGGSTNAHSKLARECNIACGQYRIYVLRLVMYSCLLHDQNNFICDWILENQPNCHTRPIPIYWPSW